MIGQKGMEDLENVVGNLKWNSGIGDFEWLSASKEQGYGINNLGLEFGSYTKQAPLSRADEGKLPLF